MGLKEFASTKDTRVALSESKVLGGYSDKYPMRLLVFFLTLMSLTSYALTEKTAPVVVGVMVKVKDKKVVEGSDFKNLKAQFKLTQKKSYPSLNVFVFTSSQNSELANFCKSAIGLAGVVHCELDYKLQPQNDLSCPEVNKQSITKILDEITCEIVPKKPSPHNLPGLSAFWAQEYTGADLAREKLKGFTAPKNLIGIWDSSNDDHGQKVANIIMGPHASALIPSEDAPYYLNLSSSSDYVSAYESASVDLAPEYTPLYINNSMSWTKSKIVSGAIEKVAEKSVFVTTTDNEANFADPEKIQLAKKEKVLLVGSLSPDGFGSNFSSYTEETAISAPSDKYITSYADYSPRQFGGTSGAAPQVTAALAAFTMVTGYHLTVPEAKKLLTQTALPFAHYPGPNSLGPGMLNSYKITEVALRMAKECEGKKSDCIKNKLSKDESYQFKVQNTDLLKKAKLLFPECHGEISLTVNNCEEKKKVFNEIRAEALLNPDRSELWSLISCVSKNDGLEVNAKYYDAMAKRKNKTDEELIAALFKEEKASLHLINFLYTHPTWKNRTDWIDELIKEPKYESHIIMNILGSPELNQKPEWIEKIINSNADKRLLMLYALSQPHWGNHPEFIEKLLESPSNDFTLSSMVLGSPHWSRHPEFVEKLILRGENDYPIQSRILSVPEWQKVFAEKYNLQNVTVEEIRKKLRP